MDVRCSRCGTEYELDDSRVAASGTTVKCSSCGHVFKVTPSGVTREPSGGVPRTNTATPVMGSVPAPGRGSSGMSSSTASAQAGSSANVQPTGEWMVKKTDGQVFRFRELTTLQKWIVERKVAKLDEISRTGRSWKRLGEIAELDSFFQVVEAADAAQRAVTASMMPQVHLTATPTGTFKAFPMPQPGTPGFQPGMNPLAIPADSQLPEPAPAPMPVGSSTPPLTLGMSGANATSSGYEPTEPVPRAPSQRFAPAAASPSPAPMAVSSSDSIELDGDDPVLAWQRRRRRVFQLTAAVAGALVVGAVVVVVKGMGGSALSDALEAQAHSALRAGTSKTATAAITALQQEPGPAGEALGARLTVARAAAALDAARLSTAQLALLPAPAAGATDPARVALEGQGKALATAAERDLAAAAATVVRLRTGQAPSAEADLAAADLALARRDLGAVQKDTALARDHARGRSPAFVAIVDDEVRLLLTLAEAVSVDVDAAANNGAGAAEKAAAVVGKLNRFAEADARARAQQAMTALLTLPAPTRTADGGIVALTDELAAPVKARFLSLPEDDPRRTAGLALLAARQNPPPPPALPPVDGATDGATDGDDDKPDDASTNNKPDDATSGEGDKPDVASAPKSFADLMKAGQRAADRGSSRAAYTAFKEAVKLEPRDATAQLKLGWAALDLSKNAEAVRAFRASLSSGGPAEGHFGLAEALRFSGDKEAAVASYQRYLELQPAGRDARVAQNAIKQLTE